MSFLHDIFFHDTRFEISEASLAELHKFAEVQGVAESIGRSKSAIFGRDEVSYENVKYSGREAEGIRGNSKICGGEAVVNFGRDEVSYENASASSTQTEYFKELRSPLDIANPQFSGETKSRTKITKASQIQLHHPTLFWCVFVAHYGYSEYLRIGNRFQNRELEEKQRMMETLSKNPKQMKEGSMKLTNDAIQEILSGLMVSSGDSFSALVAYSTYYSKTIYVVFECSYLVFSMTKESGVEIFGRDEVSYKNRIFTENEVRRSLEESDNTRTIVLYQTRKHPKYGGSYRLESDLTPEKLEHIHSTKIRMEHYAKPFRGVSSYKVAELEKMAAKIGVLDATGKAELYAKIVEKCCLGIQTR